MRDKGIYQQLDRSDYEMDEDAALTTAAGTGTGLVPEVRAELLALAQGARETISRAWSSHTHPGLCRGLAQVRGVGLGPWAGIPAGRTGNPPLARPTLAPPFTAIRLLAHFISAVYTRFSPTFSGAGIFNNPTPILVSHFRVSVGCSQSNPINLA